jgi:predicted Fe-Mo cluster-binding NifX family protein
VHELSVRIVIPVSEEKGVDSKLSQHFGMAPFFAVVELDDKCDITSAKVIANDSEHFGGVGLPPQRIIQLKPKVLVTYGMGGRALSMFQDAEVTVLRTEATTVKEVIAAYKNNELSELTDGCNHAQHTH